LIPHVPFPIGVLWNGVFISSRLIEIEDWGGAHCNPCSWCTAN